MKILIVGGWGVPEKYISTNFSNLSGKIDFYYPTASLLSLNLEEYDQVHAYSLGSLMVIKLLEDQELPLSASFHFYAPILGFCKEEGLGGKLPRKQLKWMIRQFQKAPLKTLNEFYEFSALPFESDSLPYSEADLLWGLEYLLNETSSYSSIMESICCQWSVGLQDTLLDARQLLNLVPSLIIKEDQGHDLSGLV